MRLQQLVYFVKVVETGGANSAARELFVSQPAVSAGIRELEEELGIHAEPADLQFAGKFSISFAREFHGKIFRDEEIAFVYIYDHPVEIDHLTLQKEEVEEVQWFDLEETYRQCSLCSAGRSAACTSIYKK